MLTCILFTCAGNILVDDEGHIIHIDFGFMLSNSPGGVNFEAAPFKLTRELLEVMDSNSEGRASQLFDYYKVGKGEALSNMLSNMLHHSLCCITACCCINSNMHHSNTLHSVLLTLCCIASSRGTARCATAHGVSTCGGTA